MRFVRRIALVAAALTAVTGCSGAPEDRAPTAAPTAASPAGRAEAERVARRFTDAANAGDERAVAATFAADARFDSVGRIYPSRAEIMDRFLVPEVLRAGGRYEITGSRWDGGRHVLDYRFTTRGGAAETFSYAFLVRDGLIRDVVGRYR
ncbi:hypothetical protein ACSNOI_22940 [Actinomadura kijaniata]|uniref:hypothetical protein n=1 Tax=Actinomadura kijaniata TaxID=46161 RepID=UPI003F1B3FE9